MRRIFAAAALGLVALAGCGESAPATDNGTAKIRIVNRGSDQLKQLTPINQAIGLKRAIQDSGNRCRRIDALGYQQEYERMAMWTALCDDGRTWAVFIAPNDVVQVRNCAQHEQLGLPACAPPPQLPADPSVRPDAQTNRSGGNSV